VILDHPLVPIFTRKWAVFGCDNGHIQAQFQIPSEIELLRKFNLGSFNRFLIYQEPVS
jgi:hypothetical protein